MKSKLIPAALAVALGVGVFAGSIVTTGGPAQAEPTKAQQHAVQARRGHYRMIAVNFGPLVAMAKGEAPYDKDKAALHGGNIGALAKISLAPVYLPGTDNEAMKGETRALKKIWSEFPEVAKKGAAYKAAAEALAAAAPKGLDALRGAVPALGGTCKGCHDAYRAKDF